MNSASDRETVLNHCTDDHIDDFVDEIIKDCFDAVPPKSFFVFAGAGSGKTRSLVKALQYIESKQGSYLKQHHKQIAVITYTNAACDEIRRRLQYKSVFHVATIHSFLWTLIKPFQGDIRKWLKQSLEESVRALSDKRARTRTNKAMEENAQKINEKQERLKHLDQIKVFTYCIR